MATSLGLRATVEYLTFIQAGIESPFYVKDLVAFVEYSNFLICYNYLPLKGCSYCYNIIVKFYVIYKLLI